MYPIIGDDEIMDEKAHGTSDHPVQSDLKYNVDVREADRICNYNRHYAERNGYWKKTTWLDETREDEITDYFDSVTGKRLFRAPVGRDFEAFLAETAAHGWPSFRDAEVDWDNVRVVNKNEVVSLTGTHLGHNFPDRQGNRYCINLSSIAGRPTKK